MLEQVSTGIATLDDYRSIVDDALLDEIRGLASSLRGIRVKQLNATNKGGGVAEILKSLVPLLNSVGLPSEWYALSEEPTFYQITKQIHNQLQGQRWQISPLDQGRYLRVCEHEAFQINAIPADIWIVHDPQPLALIAHADRRKRYVWRCHLDTSHSDPTTVRWLRPYVEEYDQIVFHFEEFAWPGLAEPKTNFFPPAIDPLTLKNRPMSKDEASSIVAGLGIDIAKPLITQVARFDPWKDPFGVIDAYRLAKAEIKELQLALVGVFSALDDPAALEVFLMVRDYAGADPDIHLYTDPRSIGELQVNAFQTRSNVVVQKSLREGFGLTVAEAMWKATPVVGGNTGGIRRQIRDGENGFLVSTTEECAQRVAQLIRDPDLAQRIGNTGKETVQRYYLMPRLLRDCLRIIAKTR